MTTRNATVSYSVNVHGTDVQFSEKDDAVRLASQLGTEIDVVSLGGGTFSDISGRADAMPCKVVMGVGWTEQVTFKLDMTMAEIREHFGSLDKFSEITKGKAAKATTETTVTNSAIREFGKSAGLIAPDANRGKFSNDVLEAWRNETNEVRAFWLHKVAE